MEFDEAYKNCLRCHPKVPTEHPHMHGPVAAAGVPGAPPTCKLCHTPHESREPSLLKDSPVKVCTQCHDAQLLGAKPRQHLDGTSCIQCHYGHGGDAHNTHFLKPNVRAMGAGTQPAAWPATQPATQPATRPSNQQGAATISGLVAQGGAP